MGDYRRSATAGAAGAVAGSLTLRTSCCLESAFSCDARIASPSGATALMSTRERRKVMQPNKIIQRQTGWWRRMYGLGGMLISEMDVKKDYNSIILQPAPLHNLYFAPPPSKTVKL